MTAWEMTMRLPQWRFRPWVAAILFCFLPAPLAARDVVVLASGPKGSAYHRLAEGMKRRLEAQYEVRIEPQPDCVESMKWLEAAKDAEEGFASRFAFAQQDVIAERFRLSPATPIRVVDRIAFDYLHIFVRESLGAETVADLARRRTWLGEEGSGVRYTADHILLDVLGMRLDSGVRYKDLEPMLWPDGDLRVEPYAVEKLPAWLRQGRLDAAMVMAPLGAREVMDVMRYGDSRLLALDPATRRKLLALHETHTFLRHLAFVTIPKWSYDYQENPVSTLAVPVLLLAREETGSGIAVAVRDAAVEEWRAVLDSLRRTQGLQRSSAVPEVEPLAAYGLKLLPGVDRIDPRPRRIPGWGHALLALAGIFVLLRQRWLRRRVVKTWRHYPLLCGVSLPLLVGVPLITWGAYLAEREVNEYFSSFWESGWSITVYIFSGLEDRVPYTLAGHLLVTAGLFLGWICSAVATGWTASLFVRRDKKMPRSLEDHFLLLNWNDRGMDVVRQLHHEVLRKSNRTSPIVVLAAAENPHLKQLSHFGNGSEEAFDEVYSCFGDPTDVAALKRANAKKARAVVILADGKHSDERAVRSILALQEIAKAAPRSNLHVVAELIDPANTGVLKHLEATFPGRIEAVSGPRLRTCLLSQAALTEGLTAFYTDLLSVDAGTNELYAEPIPASAEGMSFRDYAALVVQKSKSPVVPVGVHRKGKVYTNPKDGEPGASLEQGDNLVLIAYGPPEHGALPEPEPSSAAADPAVSVRATAEAVPQVAVPS